MSNRNLNNYYKKSLYFPTRKEYINKSVQQDIIGDKIIDLSNTLNTFMTDKTLFPDLDTLKEIGTRINDFSQNFISTLNNTNLKADKTYVDGSLNTNYVKKTLLDSSYTQLKNYVDGSLNTNYTTKTLLDASYSVLNGLFNDISYCSSSNPNKNLNQRNDISFNNLTFYYDTTKNILNLKLTGINNTSYNFFIPNVRLE